MTTITDPEATPAVEEHLSGNGGVLPHWKAGAPFAGESTRTALVYDPATGQVTKQVALASESDAAEVISAAAAAFPAWRDTSLARRTQILFRFRELLNARKHEAAEIITSEHGKVLSDALGEITRGQEIVELACGLSHLLKGSLTENASTKVDVSSIRQPLGVVGVISPFNFPAMVPMWFFAPPRACTRLPLAVPVEYTYWAIGVDPTNEIAFTRGSVSRASTATLSPCSTLNTPSGRPASFHRSASQFAVDGSFSLGLSTTVLPAAIAIGKNHIGTMAGKLNGEMTPTTPSGCRMLDTSTLVEAFSVRLPLSR